MVVGPDSITPLRNQTSIFAPCVVGVDLRTDIQKLLNESILHA
jgi:hypothetical protein